MRALVVLAAAACSRSESPVSAEIPSIPSVICDNPVAPQYVKLAVGDTVRFRADNCGPSGPVRWTISHPAVVEIDSASGLLRARAVGSAMVVAARIQDPNVKGAAAVEVIARPSLANFARRKSK